MSSWCQPTDLYWSYLELSTWHWLCGWYCPLDLVSPKPLAQSLSLVLICLCLFHYWLTPVFGATAPYLLEDGMAGNRGKKRLHWCQCGWFRSEAFNSLQLNQRLQSMSWASSKGHIHLSLNCSEYYVPGSEFPGPCSSSLYLSIRGHRGLSGSDEAGHTCIENSLLMTK